MPPVGRNYGATRSAAMEMNEVKSVVKSGEGNWMN